MKQILQNLKTGEISLPEVPVPKVGSGSVLIQTKKSLISLGTEKMLLEFGKSSWLGKAIQQPEKVKQVLNKVKTDGVMPTIEAVFNKLDTPLPLGYSNVGIVQDIASNIRGFKVGDRVVSNGAHAELVCVPRNLVAKIPDNVDDETASFTVVSAVGLQGIRLLDPTIGETMVVIGLGLVGLLSVQILKANGVKVIGIDLDPDKVKLAESFGAIGLNANDVDVVKSVLLQTNEDGADGVLICASTKSQSPIHQAPQMCRKRGRVVLVGVVGLELNRSDFYDKEITFQVSCSYGPGRYDQHYEQKGLDYPIGFVRWTEQRNFSAILQLMSEGKLNPKSLITSRNKFENAAEVYSGLEDKNQLGILLEYPETVDLSLKTVRLKEIKGNGQKVKVGFVGAGSFAGASLISGFEKSGTHLKAIASQGGISGHHQGQKWGFESTTSDYKTLLSDQDINTIVVATRHNSHGNITLDALRAQKNVFVEKPLALTHQELDELERFFEKEPAQSILMVGFNRRFSPLVTKIKSLLTHATSPLAMIMTVNAGEIPKDHWTQDVEVGGGRLIGEACHFIDLLRFVADAKIKSSRVDYADVISKDTFSINLSFENGSVGTIHYFSNGSKDFPKERLEVFCEGKILSLDNFRSLEGFGFSGFSKMKLNKQNKGHLEEIQTFVDSIENQKKWPIPVNELFEVTRVSLDLAQQ